MNILLIVTHHPAELALIPSIKLKDYDLDKINGYSDLTEDQEIGDQIGMILDRLGLQPFSPYMSEEEMEEEFKKNPLHYGSGSKTVS